MKLLFCIGSGRKNGNTDRMVALVKEELLKIGVAQNIPIDVDLVYFGQVNLQACRGCRVCFDRGETFCPLTDDLLSIKEKMDAADGLLIASPVYVNDVSGITKNWIDRLAFVCHRPAFGGKCAFLLATVADSPTSNTSRTLNLALSTWGFYITGQKGLKTGAWMDSEEMKRKYQKDAAKIASILFFSLQKKKYLYPSFFSLMMFKIQQFAWQAADQNSVDYRYWKSKGWFEPGCNFYIPHRSNRIKTTFARFCGQIVARFVA